MPSLPLNSPLDSPDVVAQLVAHLKAGGIAAIPTDTVPGLAVLANETGARALGAIKGYQDLRPFSVHLRSPSDLIDLVESPPPALPMWLMDAVRKGITAILPQEWCKQDSFEWEHRGLRFPQNQEWLKIADKLPGPLFMTSINNRGEDPLVETGLVEWLRINKEVFSVLSKIDAEHANPSQIVKFSPLPEVIRGNLSEVPVVGLRVLIVCTGNICRSPLAEVMLRNRLARAWNVEESQLAKLGWKIASAGTFAGEGGPASSHSITAAKEIELTLDGHLSGNILSHNPADWDLVLCMSDSHISSLPQDMLAKAELFDIKGGSVTDPYGGDLDIYRITRDHLEELIDARIKAWSSWQGLA